MNDQINKDTGSQGTFADFQSHFKGKLDIYLMNSSNNDATEMLNIMRKDEVRAVIADEIIDTVIYSVWQLTLRNDLDKNIANPYKLAGDSISLFMQIFYGDKNLEPKDFDAPYLRTVFASSSQQLCKIVEFLDTTTRQNDPGIPVYFAGKLDNVLRKCFFDVSPYGPNSTKYSVGPATDFYTRTYKERNGKDLVL